jgi:hypothetical protein
MPYYTCHECGQEFPMDTGPRSICEGCVDDLQEAVECEPEDPEDDICPDCSGTGSPGPESRTVCRSCGGSGYCREPVEDDRY